nr:immunoglobulin light chain junction region [Macaca mulatta]
CQQYNSFLITF